jgi:hypothetical protein
MPAIADLLLAKQGIHGRDAGAATPTSAGRQAVKAIVVESAVDAFRWGANDDGGLFNAWLNALDSLACRHEIVRLNSMFAPAAPDPAPRSPDRMYDAAGL